MGRMPLGQLHNSQVGDNEPVHFQALQPFQIAGQPLQLLLPGQGIAGDIDMTAQAVAHGHGLFHLFAVKVSG